MSEENVLQRTDCWMQKEPQSADRDSQKFEPVPWQQASVPVRSWDITVFTACTIAVHLFH